MIIWHFKEQVCAGGYKPPLRFGDQVVWVLVKLAMMGLEILS